MAHKPTLTKGGGGSGNFDSRVNYFGQDCLSRGNFFLILIFFCYFATDLIIVSQDDGFSSIPVSVSLSVRPIFKNFNANVSYY